MAINTNPLAGFAPVGGNNPGAWFANNVGYAAAAFMTDASTQAGILLTDIDAALDALSDILAANTVSPTYSPNTSSIVWTYTTPTTAMVRGDYSTLLPTPPNAPETDPLEYHAPDDPDRPNYSALQPTTVTMPSRDAVTTDAEFLALLNQGRGEVARDAAGASFEIMYQAAGFGIGRATPAQTVAQRVATTKAAEMQAKAVGGLVAERGKWRREDFFSVLKAEMDTFRDRATVTYGRLAAEDVTYGKLLEQETIAISSETERRQWLREELAWYAQDVELFKTKAELVRVRLAAEEATLANRIEVFKAEIADQAAKFQWTAGHVKQIMDEAEMGAKVYIDWGLATLNRLLEMKETIIKVKAQLAQALLSASDATLGFSGSQDIKTTG
jgi:hypothetical protein